MTAGAFWVLLAVLPAMTVVMGMAWLVQRVTNNVGWVDVFWTFGTGIAASVCAFQPIDGAAGPTWRQWLVGIATLVWCVRLGLYVALRVATSDREDVRYQRFRKDWGADFQPRMARFLLVQAPIATVLAMAALVAARNPAPAPGFADWIGLGLVCLSIGGEAVADWQMRRYRSRHAGRQAVCDQGLWALSRHPNYVCEWLVWCAYPVVALGNGLGGYAWGWLALPAPLLMWWLVVRVSGIPPLEQAMLESRGDAYRDYQARVPPFLPFLPRFTVRTRPRP